MISRHSGIFGVVFEDASGFEKKANDTRLNSPYFPQFAGPTLYHMTIRDLIKKIQICKERGSDEEAWLLVDAHLKCSPLTLSEVARRAEIRISDFQNGLLNCKAYLSYRKHYSLEEYRNTFFQHGLFPSEKIIPVLHYALMAPFGAMKVGLYSECKNPNKENIETIFQSNLAVIMRLLPSLGAHWLAADKPTEKEQQTYLLALGLAYLLDIIIVEVIRQMGFWAGTFGIDYKYVPKGTAQNWNDVMTEVNARFQAQVSKDWELGYTTATTSNKLYGTSPALTSPTHAEVLPPEALFKYLPSDRLDFFQTLRLRYAQPAVFNDPFEGKPFYPGLVPEGTWVRSYRTRFAKVLRDQYDSMDAEFRKSVPLDTFVLWADNMRPEIYDILRQVDASLVPDINRMMNETFCEKMGAFSLSESRDNQLMWAHYAESHKGFVVEFDPSHPLFTSKNVGCEDIWQLHKIEYAKERPQTYVIDLDMKAILLTKHISWSYEREWKHFRPLKQASIIVKGIPLPIHLFDFPSECIRSVTFGALMQADVRAKMAAAIKATESLRHLEVFEMQLDERRYELHMKPYDDRERKRGRVQF
jgi:hypothetical protein